ncbi:hypothetical protein pb186bvf_001763 [Paramecium bursaria]
MINSMILLIRNRTSTKRIFQTFILILQEYWIFDICWLKITILSTRSIEQGATICGSSTIQLFMMNILKILSKAKNIKRLKLLNNLKVFSVNKDFYKLFYLKYGQENTSTLYTKETLQINTKIVLGIDQYLQRLLDNNIFIQKYKIFFQISSLQKYSEFFLFRFKMFEVCLFIIY